MSPTTSPVQMLTSTQTESDEFTPYGGPMFLLMQGHAGGTWILQVKAPNGEWVDLDDDPGGVKFAGDGMIHFYGMPWLPYRISGGTPGASAWVMYGDPIPGRLMA